MSQTRRYLGSGRKTANSHGHSELRRPIKTAVIHFYSLIWYWGAKASLYQELRINGIYSNNRLFSYSLRCSICARTHARFLVAAYRELTIIGRGWAKYRNLSVASWSIICRSRKIIIDLRDTDKSRYFSITEFNNCFIIRSPRLFFFNEYPREAKRSAIFTQERSHEGEKHGFLYACAEYYLQPNTVGWHCAWADHYLYAIICRSRDGLSANEKKEKFASNGSQQYSTENTVEPLFNGHLGDRRKWPFWRGDS